MLRREPAEKPPRIPPFELKRLVERRWHALRQVEPQLPGISVHAAAHPATRHARLQEGIGLHVELHGRRQLGTAFPQRLDQHLASVQLHVLRQIAVLRALGPKEKQVTLFVKQRKMLGKPLFPAVCSADLVEVELSHALGVPRAQIKFRAKVPVERRPRNTAVAADRIDREFPYRAIDPVDDTAFDLEVLGHHHETSHDTPPYGALEHMGSTTSSMM